jgi:hypothetical protein
VSTVKRKDKYIGDFTAACKIVLGCEPEAWSELFEENKTTTQKSCEDVPLGREKEQHMSMERKWDNGALIKKEGTCHYRRGIRYLKQVEKNRG